MVALDGPSPSHVTEPDSRGGKTNYAHRLPLQSKALFEGVIYHENFESRPEQLCYRRKFNGLKFVPVVVAKVLNRVCLRCAKNA